MRLASCRLQCTRMPARVAVCRTDLRRQLEDDRLHHEELLAQEAGVFVSFAVDDVDVQIAFDPHMRGVMQSPTQVHAAEVNSGMPMSCLWGALQIHESVWNRSLQPPKSQWKKR